MSWYEQARAVIQRVHADLPDDLPFKERKRAIQEAYPFGPRQYHPYKMWCKAQREYLARYSNPENDRKHASWREEMRAKGFVFAGDA